MKKSVKLSFLFVILSFFIHLYLSNQHYQLKYGFEDSRSLCTLNDTFNCEAVTLSPYSYFLQIPIALWGALFHLLFFVTLCLLVFNPSQRVFYRMTFSFATASVVASTLMLIVSLQWMTTYCLFCILLYILSFFNFAYLFTVGETPRLLRLQDFKNKALIFMLVSLPALAFLVNDISIQSHGKKSDALLQDSISQWEQSKVYAFEKPLLQYGPQDAAIQVVEFADFQCIHCKHSAPKLHAFFLSHPEIHFSFFAFPLDGKCNPGASVRDGTSCVLARAVYCAEKQNKGWQAHKWIYDRFESAEKTQFDIMKTQLSLSADLDVCLESTEAIEAIEAQSRMGQTVKIEGTPSVFLNGKRLPAGHYIPILEGVIQKIKAAKNAP